MLNAIRFLFEREEDRVFYLIEKKGAECRERILCCIPRLSL